jgi:hypothetical protein
MIYPEGIVPHIWYGNYVEAAGYSLVVQGVGDHRHPLPCREGIVDGVAYLSAAYPDYEIVDLLQDILDYLEVALVEGLVPPDQEASHSHRNNQWAG